MHSHLPIPRSIPYSLAAIIITQFFAGFWYISKLDSRVEQVEKVASSQMLERITRVEVQIQGVRDGQDRMERMLNKALDGG